LLLSKRGRKMKIDITTNEIKIITENPADVAFLEYFLTKKPRAFMPPGEKKYLRLVMGNTDIQPTLLNETMKEHKRIEAENLSQIMESDLPDPPELESREGLDDPLYELHPSEIEDLPEAESLDEIMDMGEDVPEFETVDDEDIVE
jgi:hypothetical protein